MSDVGEHKAYLLRARMPDDHKHGSGIRAPEFGILDFRLKAGSKESKFYQPVDARKAPKNETGEDSFHFAPVKETIEIRYEVDDPFGIVDGGKIEIFTRFKDKPLATIDLKKLGATWLLHGTHIVSWDGRLVEEADQQGTMKGDDITHDLTKIDPKKDDAEDAPFPDGYITLEHPPYKLRLTLTSTAADKHPATAWTYCHILVKKLELALGTEDMVPKVGGDGRLKGDKAVLKRIEDDGGLPGDGATRKIFLWSNVYKTSAGEMDTNAAFDEYKSLWGSGANIPLLLKIRIADSTDAEVKLEDDKYGLALGRARFMWDWQDPDEDVSSLAAKPKAFIGAALKYYKDGTDSTRPGDDHTYPKGDNCHVDHGGKRGPGARLVFEKHDGYKPADALTAGKFPFEVKQCKTRKWASFSRGWTTGKLKGMSGAVFRPSRMAGDNYKIFVYFDYDLSEKDKPVVDVKTEPLKTPDAVMVKTGTFVVWRRLHVVRYIRKRSAIADWTGNFNVARDWFRPSYLELVDSMAGHKYALSAHKLANGSAPDYNARAEARLIGSGNSLFTHHLAHDSAANHANDPAVFRLRLYADFVQELHKALHGGAGSNDINSAATALGSNVAAIATSLGTINITPGAGRNDRLIQTKNWLVASTVETRAKFASTLRLSVIDPMEKLIGDLQTMSGGNAGKAAKDGITVVHFDHLHSAVKEALDAGDAISLINGAAIDVGDATRNRCVFVFTEPNNDTFVHEVGHHLFLPHARYSTDPTNPPGGAQADKHDDDDQNCTMSYNRPRQSFCGFCQLRLRGWSAANLSNDDATNTKP